MYGDYIAYDCWLGKVYDLKNQIILKLSNGARCGSRRHAPLFGGAAWAGGAGVFSGPAVPGFLQGRAGLPPGPDPLTRVLGFAPPCHPGCLAGAAVGTSCS